MYNPDYFLEMKKERPLSELDGVVQKVGMWVLCADVDSPDSPAGHRPNHCKTHANTKVISPCVHVHYCSYNT